MFDDILGKDEEPPLAEGDKDLFEEIEEVIESFLEDAGKGFDKSLIDSLKENIKQKDELISNFIDELSQRDELIKELKEEIDELNIEIETLNNEIVDKDGD